MEVSIQEPRKPFRRIILVMVLLILAAAMALVYLLVFWVNRFSLTLELTGGAEMSLEYGQHFQEPGVKAILRGTQFWQDGAPFEIPVTVSSDLNESVLGKHTITYEAKALGIHANAKRCVRIIDTVCPTITLVADPEGLKPSPHYQEAGYSAADNYDGDLTDRVVVTEEQGKVTYVVLDSSGNPGYAVREIPVYDITPPVITLTGGSDVTIYIGEQFTDPGFRAEDDIDGDITESVVVDVPEMSKFERGCYEITYTVADANGNVTKAVRTVTVAAKEHPSVQYPSGKVIYLTFDDGPGPDTGRLLDILKAYDVKATFFVVDTGYPETMRRICSEGHSIAVHTMSHNYQQIYKSKEAYFEDLLGMQKRIYEITGVRTWLMRFPGGSSNMVSHNTPGIMTELVDLVQDAGFSYFDWNADSNDAGGAHSSDTVYQNVTEAVKSQRISVVLQHDIHRFSVDAVERIIQWGQRNGYAFLPLEQNSPGMHHGVNN